MPFTLSHTAAALPFRKLDLVWSAFIVGSMAPDFPYIIGNVDYREIGHRFPGVIWFTIPAALASLWLFHNFVKRPVTGLLPAGMQLRLRGEMGDFRFGGPARFLAIVASVGLGVLTHLAWDSITHPFTWAFYHVPGMDGWVHVPFIGAMPMHAALQYASSVAGLLALAIWVALWYRRTAPAAPQPAHSRIQSRFPVALGMLAIAGMAGLARAFAVVGTPATRHNADKFVFTVGVTAMALAFWELVLYCVLVTTHQAWTL